jgi:hypothetical protein
MELRSKLIFPNPFKPVGIEFDLAEDAVVTLTMVDETGKDVNVILNGKQHKAGHHAYYIDFSREIGKQYVYRLVATNREGESVETKRIC